ncbi:heterogeneous nuclear ribonucleoproteins C1/C2-like [Liolophura sinensis]|uniref:heterogeneous nuclear ribonucleoproteins C1/C2-like n=1 Tax=Liolophura sinensis TaxID=3198878 RepID=UPI003158B25A
MYGSNFPPRMGPNRPNMGPGGGMGPGGHRMGPAGMGGGMGPGRMDHGPGYGRIDHGPNMGLGPAADVGNVTNDPNSIHCRVFVGNLNTHLMTKEDVERIFCNYGVITGISMHKGYAFVQYTNPGDARRAAVLEDGKVYANMRLDANVASEPKGANVRGQKRGAGNAVNTRQISGPNKPSWQGSGPPNKKVRTDTNPSMKRTLVTISSSTPGATTTKAVIKKPMTSSVSKTSKPQTAATKQVAGSTALNTSSGDILICGRCRAMFPNVHRLAMHKKVACVVKTNCKCQSPSNKDLEPSPLNCANCSLTFLNAWDLVQHCQGEHSLNIYKTSTQAQSASQGDVKAKTEAPEADKDPLDDVNGADDIHLDEAQEEALLNEADESGAGDN